MLGMHREDKYPKSSKPYTRWWWFSGEIKEEDIRYQLDWLKSNSFGGVEIAWVYPLENSKPGPKWLSDEWSRKVAYAKQYATEIGLVCDFTIGSLWPLGGSIVSEKDAAQVYDGLSPQRLTWSWEGSLFDEEFFILNHIDKNAVEKYLGKIIDALSPALQTPGSALFLDSWEVDTEGMWTDGFGDVFRDRFGYSIDDFMERLDDYPDERYNYRKLVSEYVLDTFYRTFSNRCRELGVTSRVQCHGAPTDLLAAYSLVDIPETEAMLFEPNFAKIAASAATLSSKNVVSAETFSCIYGWEPRPGPGPYIKQERITDLKMIADAMFANGVNHIIWHGTPYNPKGGENKFYATTHVGPDSPFAAQLPTFNRYMQTICDVMKRGRTYSDVAVYFPLEDAGMLGELTNDFQPRSGATDNPVHGPQRGSGATDNRVFEVARACGELLPPNAKHHWEMRYTRMPDALHGYHPLWISPYHLKKSTYDNGLLKCGDASFSSLYIDVEWLDDDGLNELLHLAQQGLPVCMKRRPKQPGHIKSKFYESTLDSFLSLPNVISNFHAISVNPPLVEGDNLPGFWCRIDGDEYHIFFANPDAKDLHYPLPYERTMEQTSSEILVCINAFDRQFKITLAFEPYESILLMLNTTGENKFTDLNFVPVPPVQN